MIAPKLHEKESKRLEALRNSGLLDKKNEKEYDDITRLASFITRSPVSMVSLIDSEKQIFKSKIGLEEDETSRDESFCGHAILETDVFVVEDASKDERFHDNPFVTKRKLKFYAGAQLRTDDGLPLGMLCVMDEVPRKLSAEEKEALEALSRQVIAQMKLKEKNKEVTRELEVARSIQYSMLPKPFKPRESNRNIEIVASMNCAKEVGGDLYDYFYLDDQRLAFVLGDVSGKGVPAAMYMAMTKILIQALAKSTTSITECINKVNDLLVKESVSNMFITLFYGVLNVKTGELEYVNAGHNQPIYLRRDGTVEELNTDSQLILGVAEGYAYSSGKLQLNDGDTIVLYTDGITEAFDKEQNEYTEKRLIKFLWNCCNKSLEQINDDVIFDVYNHSQGMPQSDDMTMLLLRYAK